MFPEHLNISPVWFQVRQVEYKDKMEEEWELFQKAMKEENVVCYHFILHVPNVFGPIKMDKLKNRQYFTI